MTSINEVEYIEVISGSQRRRRWTAVEKARIVQETLQPGMNVSYIARKYELSASLIFTWRRRMKEGGIQAIQADDEVVAASELKKLKVHIRELERMLGKKTMEVEILREAVKVGREKKLISRTPLLEMDDFE